jgi:hypothetical protein
VDVIGFGENIHLRLGIGYTEDEFARGHEDGTIAGHVGFPESVEMVCERLGLDLDRPVEENSNSFFTSGHKARATSPRTRSRSTGSTRYDSRSSRAWTRSSRLLPNS